MASLDAYRLRTQPAEIKRIVVAVDPAVSANESSDEHGLIVAGIDGEGRGVVLEDATLRGGPSDWARRAVSLYTSWGADAVIVERNQGGDMVAHTVRTISAAVNIREVTATRGKHVRAEPIAALYEQGKVVHVGAFPELETQMTQMTNSGYQGNGSPDRLDALVWALTDLFPDMIEPVRSIPLPVMPRTSHGWMGA
jgi:phage terminase large subunit-like protein